MSMEWFPPGASAFFGFTLACPMSYFTAKDRVTILSFPAIASGLYCPVTATSSSGDSPTTRERAHSQTYQFSGRSHVGPGCQLDGLSAVVSPFTSILILLPSALTSSTKPT